MLERLCLPIQEELRTVEEVLVREMVSGSEKVDAIARYVIKNGGKRIRPILFLLASHVAGASGEELPRVAAAIEMLHTASLLHDDVIDDATIRRGQLSAKAKWGNQISVLIGDFLFCQASKIIVERNNSHLMDVSVNALKSTTEGELLEIVHQNDIAVDSEIYMRIIGGKTSALFELAAKAGAIVAGVGSAHENIFHNFGFAVGIAFQLADDALDYVADESLFGKTAGTDLREGKLTYPLIVALSKASEEERQIIRDALIAGCQTPEQFHKISSIIEKHGGIEATWELARKFSDDAKAQISVFKPSIERESLFMLADYAVERRK